MIEKIGGSAKGFSIYNLLPKVKVANKSEDFFSYERIKMILENLKGLRAKEKRKIYNLLLEEEDTLRNSFTLKTIKRILRKSNLFPEDLSEKIGNELGRKTIEVSFKREKIIESLMRETTLNKREVLEVTELLLRRIIASSLRMLTAPEIREMACGILIEKHFEADRYRYSSPRIPYYDLQEKCNRLEKVVEEKRFSIVEKKLIKERIRDDVFGQIINEFYEMRKIISYLESVGQKE